MLRTQVYFSQEEIRLIEALASQRGVKKSWMLRYLVKLGAKQVLKKKIEGKISAGKALMELADKAVVGPKDLSSKVGDYLYGKKSEYAFSKNSR